MLKSLHIKNFRILEDFNVEKLGRINLIVGKNNSGKSTVLEALRIFAGNANTQLLEDISSCHDERSRTTESDFNEKTQELPFEHFFPGRVFPLDANGSIVIGESPKSKTNLVISHSYFRELVEELRDHEGDISYRTRREYFSKSDYLNLAASDKNYKQTLRAMKSGRLIGSFDIDDFSPNQPPYPYRNSRFTLGLTPCSFVPTQFISFDELADIWDKILFTDYEKIVIDGLTIIDNECENIAFVKSDSTGRQIAPKKRTDRVAKVKMKGANRAVPLNSMGDGMLRILQLILKVIPAKGGFLLIDEFENGLHYSVQEKVWSLLFKLAELHNIQVFATTHSWDCVESFAKTSRDSKESEGVLFRVGKSVRKSNYGKVVSTIFDEDKLFNITQAEVEVR